MIPRIASFVPGLLVMAAPLWAQDAVNDAPAGHLPPSAGGSPTGMNDIHDIKPVLAIGADLSLWLWIAAGLVLFAALALAVFLWRRHKRSKDEQAAEPVVPADVQAFNALDALAARGDVDGKTFYFRLSAILRDYLEQRYRFAAAEMTTEELLPAVDRLGWAMEMNAALKEFCRASDPIKFADAPANRDRMVSDLAYVRQMVIQTRAAEAGLDGEEDNGNGPDAAQPAPAAVTTGGQTQPRIAHEPAINREIREP